MLPKGQYYRASFVANFNKLINKQSSFRCFKTPWGFTAADKERHELGFLWIWPQNWLNICNYKIVYFKCIINTIRSHDVCMKAYYTFHRFTLENNELIMELCLYLERNNNPDIVIETH